MAGTALEKLKWLVKDRWRYWCPSVSDPGLTASRLREFYTSRADYHAMTAKTDKREHAQVKVLLSHIKPTDTCVEFGCGGGVVLEAVSERAKRVVGIDIATLGLSKAVARCRERQNAACARADVAFAPIKDQCADIVYSLEVLEHVWNPEMVLSEMIRVLRPGGLLFLSTPNGFSLDLHLKLRWPIRIMNLIGAATVFGRSLTEKHTFRNTEPDLCTVPSYSDCDMITKIFPLSLVKWLERHGCSVERMETYFFQKAKSLDPNVSNRYAALAQHPFYRYFGDHIVLISQRLGPVDASSRSTG